MVSNEGLHEPVAQLQPGTVELHRALISLMEELEAIDWYAQRADASADDSLRTVLRHNRNEEIEHAMMLLEWIRRNDEDFARHARKYLFTERPVTEIEQGARGDAAPALTLGVGSLKGA